MTAPTPAPAPRPEPLVETMSREVRAVQDIVRSRFGGLDPEQLAWSPEEGAWGIGECLEHLLKTNHLYLKQMEPAVASLPRIGEGARLATPGNAFGRWFTRLVGPGSRMKLPAPGSFRPPKVRGSGAPGPSGGAASGPAAAGSAASGAAASGAAASGGAASGAAASGSGERTLENVVPRFLAQQDRILQLLRDAEGRPLDEARIRSPATRLIRFRMSDAVRAMISHVWRHIGQAERVLEHPGFPLRPPDGAEPPP